MIEDTPGYREMMRMTRDDFLEILRLIEPDITPRQVTGGYKVIYIYIYIILSRQSPYGYHANKSCCATDTDNTMSCHWRDLQILELPVPNLKVLFSLRLSVSAISFSPISATSIEASSSFVIFKILNKRRT